MGSLRSVPGSTWSEAVTNSVVHRRIGETLSFPPIADDNLFAIVMVRMTTSLPTEERDLPTGRQHAMTRYLSRQAGMCIHGSWGEVAARVESEASTSSQGALARRIENDPHPKPTTASRVRQLKEDAGITWDQTRRLFGVSRRAVHMWATGAKMNSQNEERLTELLQIVSRLGTSPEQRREALMNSPSGSGRSLFQKLLLERRTHQRVDVEALLGSTSGGDTIHGKFLFAEAVGDRHAR